MDQALQKEVQMLSKRRIIDEAIERGDSQVQQFYKDATLLISGGTGFMGKQMLEKLFRACDIKKVFLLMRPKKNKSFDERLAYLLKDPVFDAVKKMKPGFEKQIHPIQADAAAPRLGINDGDYATIIAETDVIIHGAATVNFNEPLKVAVNTNVRGTVEMLNIGKQCPKLKSFVHISTAFSHATKSRIDKDLSEQFYESPLSPEIAIKMVATMDEERINAITPNLIKNWPNTYTFTKAIAEEAVRQIGSDLPICIVRPAIVIASAMEPSPGWIDRSCVYGPSGVLVGSGMGVMHTFLCDVDRNIDLVPVDMVNNAIIASEQLIDILENEVKPKFPTPLALYFIFLYKTTNRFVHFLHYWLWHFIPAYIGDAILFLMGKKPFAVKLYTKMARHTEVLSFFTTSTWLTKDKNLQGMYSTFNETDRKIFNCDIATHNWSELLVTWALGCRKYIVRDGLQGTEYGLKKQFRFKILHYLVVCPLYFLFLFKMASLTFKLVSFVVLSVLSIFY